MCLWYYSINEKYKEVLKMEEQLDQFLEQLLIDKGLTSLEGDVRKEVKEGMARRLEDQINYAIINALPEDKAIELADKIDDENFTDEQVADFVRESGVDVIGITTATMVQFRTFYLMNPEPVKEEKTEGSEA